MAEEGKKGAGENHTQLQPAVAARNLDYARATSRLAALGAVVATACCLIAVVASAYIARARNYVAAIPVGRLWDFPAVHWMNSMTRYEEDAKPIHVALKYISGLYEVDPIDFSQVKSGTEQILLSNKMAELLAYTIPGSPEHYKVSYALQQSASLFKLYSENKGLKRFLVSDMMISQPPVPFLRIEVIGRFVIFGQDGRRPVAADDLGYKSIVLVLSHDAPIFDRVSVSGEDDRAPKDPNAEKGVAQLAELLASVPKAVNAEGWYVIQSQVRPLTYKDVQDIRQIRLDSGMKGGL